MPFFDCQKPETRSSGLRAATEAIKRGQSVVFPTDTVYGIGCDAFSPHAVAGLLAIKGRGRHMPPPVLVASATDVERLVEAIPESARKVMEKFWPGGVTIIFRAHPDVSWDLGETEGTVAVRMPNNAVALELLSHTGPLAVSSGNRSGGPSAKSINEVWDQLGERVSVYLDGGLVGEMYAGSADNPGSTIVDASAVPKGGPWRVIRSGVVPPEAIFDVAQGEWEL